MVAERLSKMGKKPVEMAWCDWFWQQQVGLEGRAPWIGSHWSGLRNAWGEDTGSKCGQCLKFSYKRNRGTELEGVIILLELRTMVLCLLSIFQWWALLMISCIREYWLLGEWSLWESKKGWGAALRERLTAVAKSRDTSSTVNRRKRLRNLVEFFQSSKTENEELQIGMFWGNNVWGESSYLWR